MYLIDTNVISEVRKGQRANAGVQSFFSEASRQDLPLFLSATTIGELRLGVALIRHRADQRQAEALEAWLGLFYRTMASGCCRSTATPRSSASA